MIVPFADRLWDAVLRCGNRCCIGLDPDIDLISAVFPAPGRIKTSSPESAARLLDRFCRIILDLLANKAPVVKFQYAYFERWGWRGIKVLEGLIAAAKKRGFIVIGDVKRADISKTALAYAGAYLGDRLHMPDAVTVNPYLGIDGVLPFAETARRAGKGVFVLVRTSNPSAVQVQGEVSDPGSAVSRVISMIRSMDSMGRGARGQGLIGAVLGATYPEDLSVLAERLPNSWLLIPGLGAQGAEPRALDRVASDPGSAVLVSTSRSVIYAGGNKISAARNEAEMRRSIEAAVDDFTAEFSIKAIG